MTAKNKYQSFKSIGLFTATLMFSSFATMAGDCLVEDWPVVFESTPGAQSIYTWQYLEGECEYGVDFLGGSAAYLQIGFSDLASIPATGPLRFECRISTHDLFQAERGNIRIFEVVSTKNESGPTTMSDQRLLFAVELSWEPNFRSADAGFYLRGLYTSNHPIFVNALENHYLQPSAVFLGNGDQSVRIRVEWLPSSNPHAEDGVLNLFADGQLVASEHGLAMPFGGNNPPTAVRFGVIPANNKMGRGTLRFSPGQPTPYTPWVD